MSDYKIFLGYLATAIAFIAIAFAAQIFGNGGPWPRRRQPGKPKTA
ncbi:MAG: hypothetical protein Q8P83_01600 [bacterium]|nr:hypothetical protein [bacterium]